MLRVAAYAEIREQVAIDRCAADQQRNAEFGLQRGKFIRELRRRKSGFVVNAALSELRNRFRIQRHAREHCLGPADDIRRWTGRGGSASQIHEPREILGPTFN